MMKFSCYARKTKNKHWCLIPKENWTSVMNHPYQQILDILNKRLYVLIEKKTKHDLKTSVERSSFCSLSLESKVREHTKNPQWLFK